LTITRWHRGALRRANTLQRGRSIGLYGGSFNPAHEGHLHVALKAIKYLNLDEIWLLVSPGNPLKNDSDMAPFEARFDSLKELVTHHPNLKVCNVETGLNTRFAIDTIRALQAEMPHTNFVWLMGADNFLSFDKWHKWEQIARMVPIAIFDRSGYALKGFARGLGKRFGKFRSRFRAFDVTQKPNWTFVAIPRHPGSATEIRARKGKSWHSDKEGKET
jgi:nicotinate-nucleotide adenylyltransferase